MTKNTISVELLAEVLETADLFDDEARPRASYRGRGYAPDGFGITFETGNGLSRFMVALGTVVAQKEADGEAFDWSPMELARDTQQDSMGLGMIAYWPGWTLEGELADYFEED
jgi:hypothetical protein